MVPSPLMLFSHLLSSILMLPVGLIPSLETGILYHHCIQKLENMQSWKIAYVHCFRRHWLVVNIPGNEIHKGKVLTPYAFPLTLSLFLFSFFLCSHSLTIYVSKICGARPSTRHQVAQVYFLVLQTEGSHRQC